MMEYGEEDSNMPSGIAMTMIGGSVVFGGDDAPLLGRGKDADAEWLREEEEVAGLAGVVALEPVEGHPAGHREAEDGLRAVDAVSPGQRDARFRTDGPTAVHDLARDVLGQLVERPTEDGDRHQRGAAHRVDVADGIRRGDAAEGARIIDDGHEKVRRGDDARSIAEVHDRGIVLRLVADEEPGEALAAVDRGQDAVQDGRRQLAAAARSVRVGRQTDGGFVHAPKVGYPPPSSNSATSSADRPRASTGWTAGRTARVWVWR